MLRSAGLTLMLSAFQLGLATPLRDPQAVLGPSPDVPNWNAQLEAEKAILVALEEHSDPVDALVALQPELAEELAQPRLLRVLGEVEARWHTEGDKLRLRRAGKKFIDITDHQDFYSQPEIGVLAGKASESRLRSPSPPIMDPSLISLHRTLTCFADLPKLTHQSLVNSLFPRISTERMHDVLEHMTGYYNRYYGGPLGQLSAEWLHDYIAKIIESSPFGTHISLEYFTHPFPQPSIIARFEPKVRNSSQPLTVLGAHQDSANYLFPLLPAPGADDDCSGTVSILEAFHALAKSGYTPKNGPVEFHWYAAEEGGLLGSQAIARYKKEQGANIGAMMEFDMTAWIARNSTEMVAFVATQADASLTNWTVQLAREYLSIPAGIFELGSNAGSDYMSYTQLNYPAAFATEGNPMHGGFPGDMDPLLHTIHDRMDANNEHGYFSIDHMARFTELAIAFAVEQGGWDNAWR